MAEAAHQIESRTAIGGRLGLKVIRGDGSIEIPGRPTVDFNQPAPFPDLAELRQDFLPRRGLSQEVNEYRIRNLPNIWRGYKKIALAKRFDITTIIGLLYLSVQRGDGEVVNLGLASTRLVTSAGVNYLAADMAAGANDINLFKFHGFGTGGTAESTSDTALVTELTTQYATDNTRPTGSQNASTNTYTTVATLSPDANVAITEHGIFTQAATGGGTLWDRSLFSVINLVASADSLQATYVATFAAGG